MMELLLALIQYYRKFNHGRFTDGSETIGSGHETITAGWYVRPTVVNITTAGSKTDVDEVRLSPPTFTNGVKTVCEGGSGTDNDEVPVVVIVH
jgi:hypothetical protein